MARKKPRRSVGVRILMGVARILAAALIAVAASAALADLDIGSIEFSRILPVILTGEGIIYILMLGGGTVAAPVLLLSVVLGFAVRAGIAVAAGALSPQVSGDLIASAQFYYASYWSAAVAQVLMVAVGLRLIRPLVATRRPRSRRGRPEVAEALQDSRAEEERHDRLLEAIGEEPGEPPVSPTVLEERQIGDLAEAAAREPEEEEVEQTPALPFDEEEAPEAQPQEAQLQEAEPQEAEAEEDTPESDEPLPPGVIDATPEAKAAAVEEPERDEAEAAPEAEPAEVADELETTQESAPGEDTARLAPVSAEEPVGQVEIEPPENLQEMIDVISGAAGEGTDVRVWRTSDGRTVLAAVPSGTPAAGTGGHADALVGAHLEVCAWLGADATCQQLAATPIGAWALQALDSAGATMLIMAARGDAAAGRIQLAATRVAEAVRGMAEDAQGGSAPQEPAEAASALPLSPHGALAEEVNGAVAGVGGRFRSGWQAWRGPQQRIIAAHTPPGAEAEAFARRAARMVAPIERFADAVALDGPDWVAVSSGSTLLAAQWARRDGEPVVLAAAVSDGSALGKVRWELAEVAHVIAE